MAMSSKVAMIASASVASSLPAAAVNQSAANLKRVYVTNNCDVPIEVGEWGPPGSIVLLPKSTRDLPARAGCPDGRDTCIRPSPMCDGIVNDGPCYEPNRFKWRQAQDEPPAFDFMEMNGLFLGSNTGIDNQPNFANWQGYNGIGMSVVAYRPDTRVPACSNAGALFDSKLEDCAAAGGTLHGRGEVDKFKCQFPTPAPGTGIYQCGSPSSNYLKEHYFALQKTGDGGSLEPLPRRFACPAPHGSGLDRAMCYQQVGYWTEPTQPCFAAEPHLPEALRPGIGMWAELLYQHEDFDVEFTFCPATVLV